MPASGNSILCEELKAKLSTSAFQFFDAVNFALDTFAWMDESQRNEEWSKTIFGIGAERKSGRTGLIAGFFSVFPTDEDSSTPIRTKADQEGYTHVLYLDVAKTTCVDRVETDSDLTDHLMLSDDDVALVSLENAEDFRDPRGLL